MSQDIMQVDCSSQAIDSTMVDLANSEVNFSLSPGQLIVDPSYHSSDDRAVSPGTLSVHSQDSLHEEKGELDVHVVTARDLRRQNSYAAKEMPCYKMDARPRGMALIIEIESYVNDVHDRRIGSHHDVTNLKRLFEGLLFEVDIRRNLTRPEFESLLDQFAHNPGHQRADMMILVILSHGMDGLIYTADSRAYLTESIYARFNNQNCPLLKGKPKFFIVQACRGEFTDTGLQGDDEAAEKIPRKRRAGTDRDTIPIGMNSEMNRARPTWEDMVIAYSSIPGFASIRDHEKGTWFIQSLVEVFMEHACEKELIDLLRMTSEYLSHFTNDMREKQTCNVELRHLYKRIYFNPGNPRMSLSPMSLTRSKSTPPASPRRSADED